MKTWLRAVVLTSLVGVALAACDDGTGPGLVDEEALRADLAVVVADGIFRDVDLMVGPGEPGLGIPGLAPSLAGQMGGMGQGMGQGMGFQSCTRTGTAFRCPAFARDGFSFTREITFYDADGNVQERYDSLTTASIRIVVDAEGYVERANWSAEVERHRDMTVSGLEGMETQRTWDGTAEGSVFRSRHVDDEAVRTYDMEMDAVIESVVIPFPREEGSWPLSGTITRNVKVKVMVDDEVVREVEKTVVVTFNGTQFAEMTVDGETFTIDLSKRSVKRGRFGHRGG